MSPRRKIDPEAQPAFPQPLRAPRRWGLPIAVTLAAAVAATAIVVCALVLSSHEDHHRATINDAVAVGYVRSFMTEFTSPDPFHANDYADRVLAQATGGFADQYRQNENEILIGIARSDPTTGTVLDAGVSRRNDDGSVDVLVVTKLTSQSPDGKVHAARANRWVVTTRQEGTQWKISSLIPMT
ncbi:mammalian cell entry protein [Mycobacterium hodleri]|uniref:Mammalian cell entry protein n=1 Tax=Mycolicibacterium hodleri TaxID=49897 RepID=A0A544VWG1_9MYCO|nr:mammalian cell entry protein [Mycolicibacterium hodleri]TQR84323.1 mammalian cell entry protein [Mycolicibacterium hodleri]